MKLFTEVTAYDESGAAGISDWAEGATSNFHQCGSYASVKLKSTYVWHFEFTDTAYITVSSTV